MTLKTYLIAGIDDDVGAAKEVGDCAGVGVEEALAGYGDSVTTPVDLHKLGQRALWRKIRMRLYKSDETENVH